MDGGIGFLDEGQFSIEVSRSDLGNNGGSEFFSSKGGNSGSFDFSNSLGVLAGGEGADTSGLEEGQETGINGSGVTFVVINNFIERSLDFLNSVDSFGILFIFLQ